MPGYEPGLFGETCARTTLRPFCLMKFNVPTLIIQGTDDQIVTSGLTQSRIIRREKALPRLIPARMPSYFFLEMAPEATHGQAKKACGPRERDD